MPNIREKIDQHYAKEYYKRGAEEQDYWRVSSIGMPWDAYHKRANAPLDEEDPYDISRGQMIMDMGTGIHRIIQDIVRQLAKDKQVKIVGMEAEVSDDKYNVKGHYDMFLNFDGYEILYDIKTINERAYTRMKTEGGGSIKPYDHHIKQLLAYDWLLGEEADELRILYVDRNNGRREEIPVERNPSILEEVFAEWDMLNACWESKTPPPAPDMSTFQYKYSNYKNLIHEALNG
jgi:hypothetical protein